MVASENDLLAIRWKNNFDDFSLFRHECHKSFDDRSSCPEELFFLRSFKPYSQNKANWFFFNLQSALNGNTVQGKNILSSKLISFSYSISVLSRKPVNAHFRNRYRFMRFLDVAVRSRDPVIVTFGDQASQNPYSFKASSVGKKSLLFEQEMTLSLSLSLQSVYTNNSGSNAFLLNYLHLENFRTLHDPNSPMKFRRFSKALLDSSNMVIFTPECLFQMVNDTHTHTHGLSKSNCQIKSNDKYARARAWTSQITHSHQMSKKKSAPLFVFYNGSFFSQKPNQTNDCPNAQPFESNNQICSVVSILF